MDSREIAHHSARVVLEFLGEVPTSDEHARRAPDARVQVLAAAAARKAALAAGTLALPPGPLGWITLVPELVAIWKIQAQMVADIAATYGVTATLSREHMLYCLFRHAAAQAVRDVAVRIGGRYVVQKLSSRALADVAARVGLRLSQRTLGGAVARWVPVVGAVGVGMYAWYDTNQVAHTAIELFARGAEPPPAQSPKKRARPAEKAKKRAPSMATRRRDD